VRSRSTTPHSTRDGGGTTGAGVAA
jgi:hypothetical protein